MASLKSYSPKKVIVTVNGQALSGFVDGTFVTIERETDSFTKTVGVDGEVARNSVHNRSGSVTFTLMQTSDHNAFLSGILKTAENWADGVGNDPGIFTVQVKDTLNGSVYLAKNCWIRKQPNAEYANEVGGFEWVIDCQELSFSHKSNEGLNFNISTAARIDSNGNITDIDASFDITTVI